MKLKNVLLGAALIGTAASLTSCGGGGGGSTYGAYQSPYISATQFVNALNSYDGAPSWDESEVILYTDETLRSAVFGEDDWFVIYDAKYDENKAVSLQYIRSIVYYDYYQSNYSTAEEFRDIESDDIFAGDVNGDFWGDDYEVVDAQYNIFGDFLYFEGRNSGFAYEDEAETTDVALMAGEKQQKQFLRSASRISFAYEVSIETAMSLVTLGDKVEKMVKKGAGQQELTLEDQAAITNDIKKLTGVSFEDMIAAGMDAKKKEEVVKKVADKIGTSASTLEGKILPELFGIQ